MQFLKGIFICLKEKNHKTHCKKKTKSFLGNVLTTYSFTRKNGRIKIDYGMLVGKC